MKEIVNNVLLAGDEFMPEMHLKQTGFTCVACGPLSKNKDLIQKFKETGASRYISKNELNKACFQHDMAYGGFKDLAKRTASDLTTFSIAKNPTHVRYQRVLVSRVYKFFDKKSKGSDSKNEIKQNQQQLAEGLHKPIIRKIKK